MEVILAIWPHILQTHISQHFHCLVGGVRHPHSQDNLFLYLKYFVDLMKFRPNKQNLVTNIFKSKWPPAATLEVKVRKMLIFNDSHNLKTRIYRKNNDQTISWDLGVISIWNFHNMTDDVIFIPGVSSNFIPFVEVEITCVYPLKLLEAY